MVRRVVVLVAFAIVLAACAGLAPETRLEAYLRAAAGGEEDRGWHFIDETIREESYANDRDSYVRNAEAANWEELRWTDASIIWIDDGFASVEVELLSTPSTVPAFLIANGFLHGVCKGGTQPMGLGAFVDARPLGAGTLSAGGLTGSQVACNSRFIGADAYDE